MRTLSIEETRLVSGGDDGWVCGPDGTVQWCVQTGNGGVPITTDNLNDIAFTLGAGAAILGAGALIIAAAPEIAVGLGVVESGEAIAAALAPSLGATNATAGVMGAGSLAFTGAGYFNGDGGGGGGGGGDGNKDQVPYLDGLY